MSTELGTEVNWRGYCRTIALGTSHNASCARLCMRLQGNTPSAMRAYIEQQLTNGKMLDDSYRTNIEAIDHVEDMYHRGVQTCAINTGGPGWIPLRNCGGHMRRAHLGSAS